MSLQLVLDIVIIFLLIATIVFAARLNTALSNLKKSKKELADFIDTFNAATARAESGIPKLKVMAETIGRELKEQVDKAQALRDDLAFMVERAESMENKLETLIKSARDDVVNNKNKSSVSSAVSALPAGNALRSERIGQVFDRIDKKPEAKEKPKEEAKTLLGAMALGQVASDERLFVFDDDERSEAERELIRAMQKASSNQEK